MAVFFRVGNNDVLYEFILSYITNANQNLTTEK